jgi:Domain of unknown function (DUF4287)
MTFQAYIDSIYEKTGKTPADFKQAANNKGLLTPGTTATQIYNWLKTDYDLGLGHARAIYALLKKDIPKK